MVDFKDETGSNNLRNVQHDRNVTGLIMQSNKKLYPNK